MRVVVSVLLAVHGLIHVLGFLKAYRWAELPQLQAAIPRPLGALWLVASFVLLAGAIALAARASFWWLIAAAGIALSQVLIVCAWDAAKAGTAVNLVLLIVIAIVAADARFASQTDAAIRGLLAPAPRTPAPLVQAEELRALPDPVARWLRWAGVVGMPRAVTVHLTQTGALRTTPGGPWMPATAEQYFRVDEPGFVWRVRTQMRGIPVAGRDEYRDGRGRMLITLAGLIPVVNASDGPIQQATLQRFLGETVWFPSAALRDYIRWDAIDDRSARATMSHAGVTGSAVFSFDDDGQVTRVTAQRYLGGGASARLETWTIPITEWKTFGGLRVPARGHVIWKLPAGDFDYYRWEIASLESTELRAERASGAQLAPRKPFAQPHASSSQRRGGHGT